MSRELTIIKIEKNKRGVRLTVDSCVPDNNRDEILQDYDEARNRLIDWLNDHVLEQEKENEQE